MNDLRWQSRQWQVSVDTQFFRDVQATINVRLQTIQQKPDTDDLQAVPPPYMSVFA